MNLSTNELRILGVLAEKDALEPADCTRLADLGSGMGGAALRSLVDKQLVAPNLVRKGLSKKPDGTYSITPAGRAAAELMKRTSGRDWIRTSDPYRVEVVL